MADTRIDIRYTAQDLADAQRARFLKTGQYRLILIFWAVSVVILGLHILFPQTFRFLQGVTWELLLVVTVGYLVTLVTVLFLLPFLSFHFSRFWKLPLVFQFNEKSLRLSVAEKSGGLKQKWEDLQAVQETKRVFVVYYGKEKFYFLPKSAFTPPGSERRFRTLLARHKLLEGAVEP